MPIGGSSLISLLGILSDPRAEFFVVWRMLFSSSRVILELSVESKREVSGWSIIKLMLSVVDELSLLSYFPFEFFSSVSARTSVMSCGLVM